MSLHEELRALIDNGAVDAEDWHTGYVIPLADLAAILARHPEPAPATDGEREGMLGVISVHHSGDVHEGRRIADALIAAGYHLALVKHGPRMTWTNEGEPPREGRTCTCGLAWPHREPMATPKEIARVIGAAATPTQVGFGVVGIDAAVTAVLALLEGGE